MLPALVPANQTSFMTSPLGNRLPLPAMIVEIG